MVLLAGPNKAGYRSRTGCMAGQSNNKVPLIMKSVQIATLAQALGLEDPGAPAQHIRQRGSPHPEAQQCMHAASTERLPP